jgi:hypothetical protein
LTSFLTSSSFLLEGSIRVWEELESSISFQ